LIGSPEYIQDNVKQFKVRFGDLLEQNSPNPFSSTTRIQYRVPWQEDGSSQRLQVHLEIFDLQGRSIRLMVNQRQESGLQSITWRGLNSSGIQVPSGTYIYLLRVGGDLSAKKKMIYLQ
jgi:flagellar hook assembly protein FlgD